jgi:hypothetical protein
MRLSFAVGSAGVIGASTGMTPASSGGWISWAVAKVVVIENNIFTQIQRFKINLFFIIVFLLVEI